MEGLAGCPALLTLKLEDLDSLAAVEVLAGCPAHNTLTLAGLGGRAAPAASDAALAGATAEGAARCEALLEPLDARAPRAVPLSPCLHFHGGAGYARPRARGPVDVSQQTLAAERIVFMWVVGGWV